MAVTRDRFEWATQDDLASMLPQYEEDINLLLLIRASGDVESLDSRSGWVTGGLAPDSRIALTSSFDVTCGPTTLVRGVRKSVSLILNYSSWDRESLFPQNPTEFRCRLFEEVHPRLHCTFFYYNSLHP